MKTIRYAFWAIVALCLVLVGLANTAPVTVRAMPEAFSGFLGISPDIELPLFIIIFTGVAAGLLIGFLWEWVRESRIRSDGRAKSREAEALKREVAELRASKAKENGDDILALIDAK